ncbi:MAG: peptide deformylase [bacterium]|nr:peptide deformylase [bacterium]
MKKIVTVPYPTLRKEAKEIKKITKDTKEIAVDLWYALTHSSIEGVGIAAPQIGTSERMFILREGKENYQVYINPTIVWSSEISTTGFTRKGDTFLEGCLSIPNIYGVVIRPDSIEMEYLDLQGKKHRRKYKEPFSRYAQHEIDHLNGVLFTDHVISQKGKLYVVTEEDELEEISLDALMQQA